MGTWRRVWTLRSHMKSPTLDGMRERASVTLHSRAAIAYGGGQVRSLRDEYRKGRCRVRGRRHMAGDPEHMGPFL